MTKEVKEIDKAWFNITKHFKHTGMKKGQINKHGNYKYRSIDQVMYFFSQQLVENNLIMDVNTTEYSVETIEKDQKHSKYGEDYKKFTLIIVKNEIKFKSTLDGSTKILTHHGAGNASNNNDRALQGGVSDGWKYAIVRSFCIPVEGIPDEDVTAGEDKRKATEQSVKKKATPPPPPPPINIEVINKEITSCKTIKQLDDLYFKYKNHPQINDIIVGCKTRKEHLNSVSLNEKLDDEIPMDNISPQQQTIELQRKK